MQYGIAELQWVKDTKKKKKKKQVLWNSLSCFFLLIYTEEVIYICKTKPQCSNKVWQTDSHGMQNQHCSR